MSSAKEFNSSSNADNGNIKGSKFAENPNAANGDKEPLRLQRVIEILESELDTAICLRASQSGKVSSEMLRRQECDIDIAFRDVNYLRAELSELAKNDSIPNYRKPLISKYLAANLKELSSREHFGILAMTSAANDAAAGLTNKDWQYRVMADCKVVVETRKIRDKPGLNRNIADRKKHEYDYNRAKSILKSDYDALCLNWPSVDYSALIKLSKGDSLKKEAKIRSSSGEKKNKDSKGSTSRSAGGSKTKTKRESFHQLFF